MKATLRIPADGGYKDIEVDIAEEELAKLAEPQKPQKLTGYERTSQGKNYWMGEKQGNADSRTKQRYRNSVQFQRRFLAHR